MESLHLCAYAISYWSSIVTLVLSCPVSEILQVSCWELKPTPITPEFYALSIGAKINDLGWPWRAITHCVSKHMRLSEPTTKIWMKIDPHCQRRRCSPMSLDSGNMRFMRIFAVVLKIYVNFPLILCLRPYFTYTGMACRSRCQVQVFGLWQLARGGLGPQNGPGFDGRGGPFLGQSEGFPSLTAGGVRGSEIFGKLLAKWWKITYIWWPN